MWVFNSVFGKIFVLFFYPFQSMSPWIGMILISFLTALLMLFVYRFTSNQQGIKEVKNKIKAHLLELWLFKDSMSLTLKAQGKIIRYNLKYIGYALKPFLVMIIPIILILIQLSLWFEYKALEPGQKTILVVKLKEGQNLLNIDIAVEPSSGFDIETPPIRIEEEGEINWRLHAKEFDQKKGAGNKRAMKKIVMAGEVPGLLAYLSSEPIGWCSVAPREVFVRLERSRYFKPVDAKQVWSISCLFIAKMYRSQGVSIALLKAAVAHVKKKGGEIVEGYPVEPDKKWPDAFAWTGVTSAYLQAGFEEVLRRGPTRPIMRCFL